ncbi:MAG TPA: hypothetical protein PKC30_00180 [Saprospiraceae bacterium]|nr:hypothetical protein [Saprospiraceae bacterium]
MKRTKEMKWDPPLPSATIEEVLRAAGFSPERCRTGINNWQIDRGDHPIVIEYHEDSGMISADTVVDKIEKEDDLLALSNFLLRANEKFTSITASILGKEVVLSLIIYDVFLQINTGKAKLEELIREASLYKRK